jgi:hypothetical protein
MTQYGPSNASYVNFMQRRQQEQRRAALGLSGAVQTRGPALQTNAEATATGATPGITVSPGFGRMPAPSGNPATQHFAQRLMSPAYRNQDGQPALNDPETLEARARQAALNLTAGSGGRLNMLQGDAATSAMHAAGMSPTATAEGWSPFAVAATPPSPGHEGFSVASPTLPGPMTDPETVAANRQRYADAIGLRQQLAADRGIERGFQRDLRLFARRAGVPYQAMAGQAMGRQFMANQLGLANRGLDLRGKELEGDLELGRGALAARDRETAMREALGMGDLDVRKAETAARSSTAEKGFASAENRTRMETGAQKEIAMQRSREEALNLRQRQIPDLVNQIRENEVAALGAEAVGNIEAANRIRGFNSMLQSQLPTGVGGQTPLPPSAGALPAPGGVGPLAAGLNARVAGAVPQVPAPPARQIPEARAKANLGDADFGESAGIAQRYGGLGPDPYGAPPNTFAGAAAALASPFQMAVGGAGGMADRRAAVMASKLLGQIEQRGGAYGPEQYKAMQRALFGGMDPGYRDWLLRDGTDTSDSASYFGDDEYERPQAKFLRALLRGEVPQLSEEERRAIRTRAGYSHLTGW